MKYINKNHQREPKSLRRYRETTPNATYSGMHGSIKQHIRDILAEEQGYICAYCMRRIIPDESNMEIEHFIPQQRHPKSQFSPLEHQDGQLRYMNMLGTCYGSRSCSNIRGNIPLTVNPMRPDCERLVKFRKDGTVYSEDKNVQIDLENLQLDLLSDVRKVVIDKAREEAKKHKNWNNEFLDSEIRKWKALKRTRHGFGYEEFCMAAVHYLESKKSK